VPVCVLVGLPGSGKSVVARRVARRLGVGAVDTDRLIGGAAVIQQLWRELGEDGYRERELVVLRDALSSDGVVSTGGGVVTTATGRALLAGAPCVWLRATPEVLARRVGTVARPVLGDDPLGRLRALAEERSPWYDEVARATVDANGHLAGVVSAVVDEVTRWATCA
jgi:shikimate kinase